MLLVIQRAAQFSDATLVRGQKSAKQNCFFTMPTRWQWMVRMTRASKRMGLSPCPASSTCAASTI